MENSREGERLFALEYLEVLDAVQGPLFDNLTKLAALTFEMPAGLISLVDSDHRWFNTGMRLGAEQTPRDVAFCDDVMRSNDVMVVLDATADDRFRGNPLVLGDPNIRFYAGAPLTLPSGHKMGTLCVIDYKPHTAFGPSEMAKLKSLADCAVDALLQRRGALEASRMRQVADERLKLLRMAGGMAGIGIWAWERDLDHVAWSDEGYGHDREPQGASALSLADWLARYHPDDAAKLAKLFAEAVSEGGEFALSARLPKEDGASTSVMIHGDCRRDASGRITALFGTYQDITHLKLADAALRDREARFCHIAEAASDIISEKTVDGVLTYISPACEAVFGVPPEAMIGLNILAMVEPEDRSGLRASYAALADADRESGSAQVQFRTRNFRGEEIWLESQPSALKDPDTGEVTGFLDITRDITSHKRLEETLTQAKIAAEAAAVAKAEFLANMSHEIRTPLTAIIGFAGLLELEDLPQKAKSYAKRIVAGGHALLSVVNNILDFSKMEAGQIQLEPQPFDLKTWIEDMVDLVEERARIKKVALKVRLAPNLPAVVYADPARMRQVVLNLLINAVKFTTEGSVTLVVEPAPGLANTLHFSIIDTGMGISLSNMDRLFNRFSQIDGSATRQHGGTGLGLVICKSVVEMMGGEIGVESVEGSGSTFWFTVEAPAVDGHAVDSIEDVRPRDFSKARILIVDDVQTNRTLVSAMLAPFGFTLMEATNGAEAIDAADHTVFDLILMDLQMPGMSGLVAAKKIRATSKLNAKTPILAFSANVLPHHLAACREGGLEDHIAKPITAEDLLTKVSRWLGRADASETKSAIHGAKL